MFKIKNSLYKGIRWNIGNVKNISIWWCGEQSFMDINISTVSVNENVENLINDNGILDLNKITNFIPLELHSSIINTPLSRDLTGDDKPSWLGKGSGKFYVGYCYNQIMREDGMESCVGNEMSWLWKMKPPIKILHFLWLLI